MWITWLVCGGLVWYHDQVTVGWYTLHRNIQDKVHTGYGSPTHAQTHTHTHTLVRADARVVHRALMLSLTAREMEGSPSIDGHQRETPLRSTAAHVAVSFMLVSPIISRHSFRFGTGHSGIWLRLRCWRSIAEVTASPAL